VLDTRERRAPAVGVAPRPRRIPQRNAGAPSLVFVAIPDGYDPPHPLPPRPARSRLSPTCTRGRRVPYRRGANDG